MNLLKEFKTETSREKYISLTGYRTLLILQILLKEPKTLEEIKKELASITEINKDISDDIIRSCINNLRETGCEISKATKLNSYKYILTKHPLSFDIKNDELKALKKVSQKISDSGSLTDLENFENFIFKMINFVQSEETKEILYGMIILNKINPLIYKKICECCKTKSLVTMKYQTGKGQIKTVKLYCNKVFLRSANLYVEGYSPIHEKNQFLVLERIIDIISYENKGEVVTFKDNCAICEIYDKNFKPKENEFILNEEKNFFVVKFVEENSFIMRQKILSYGNMCKVIYPHNLQNRIINLLSDMQKNYDV